jgi:hypothetical protein
MTTAIVELPVGPRQMQDRARIRSANLGVTIEAPLMTI